jgi:hypothetical protein
MADSIQSKAIKLELNKDIINMDRDDINIEDETIKTVRSIQKMKPASLMSLLQPHLWWLEPD